MKYIDPKTKEVKTIYTKASDTLPIGSIVDFDGEEIPDGWEPAPEDATVYIGLNEPTDGQDIWIQKGPNLIDEEYYTLGTSISADDGSEKSAPNNACGTNYIEVKSNTIYTLRANTPIRNLRLSEYKQDKTHIRRNELVSEPVGAHSYTIVTSKDTKYLRWSLNYDNINDITMEQLIGFDLKLEEGVKRIYIKNEKNEYEPYIKNRVHIGPSNPTDGEEVWIQRSTNLINAGATTEFTLSKDIPCILKKGTYTIAIDEATSTGSGYESYIGFKNAKGSTFFYTYLHYSTKKLTFTLEQDVKEVTIWSQKYWDISKDVTTTFKNLRIVAGSEALPYEPYMKEKLLVKNSNGVYEEFYSKENFDIYSKEEVKIGTWIDGKPLYRKLISCGSHAGDKKEVLISVNIPDIDHVQKLEAAGTYYDIYFLPLPYLDVEGKQQCQVFFKGTGYQQIGINSNVALRDIIVTLYYTKTTD